MVPDKDERLKIDLQLESFKNAKGLFGYEAAKLTRTKKAPAEWWDSYGDECPELTRFAIRVLSLTCSASGCERNWSAFQMVHTKKRNRLHQKRMNNLIFVMYNVKLMERQKKREASQISFDDVPSDDEWITEKEGPVISSKKKWLTILNKEAESGADTSDEERVNTSTVRAALDAEDDLQIDDDDGGDDDNDEVEDVSNHDDDDDDDHNMEELEALNEENEEEYEDDGEDHEDAGMNERETNDFY